VDRFFFVHVDRSVRARFIPLDHSLPFVGSFFRGSHSLRDLFARSLGHIRSWSCALGHSLLVPLVGVIRWVIFVGCLLVGSCGRLCPFHVGCLLVGIRSRDLEWRVLEGNFCTVESL
jgi:hypothetical protein